MPADSLRYCARDFPGTRNLQILLQGTCRNLEESFTSLGKGIWNLQESADSWFLGNP
jgi:hypothetical protein